MVGPWLVGPWAASLRVLSIWAVLAGAVVALAAAFPVEAVASPPVLLDRRAQGPRATLVLRELPVRLAALGLVAARRLHRALRRLRPAQLAVELPQLVAVLLAAPPVVVQLQAVRLQAVLPQRQARLV